MNDLCTDIGYRSVNKFGEQLCGDHVDLVDCGDDSSVIVLADGLGSGVKASILSTLTSKIISTMMAQEMTLADCVETIASTLPICSVRKVAYSTFSILLLTGTNEAQLIQYDNPMAIFLRDGKQFDYPKTVTELQGKTIYQTRIALQENDTIILMSDGAIHAGVGSILNYGWQRESIADYMEANFDPSHTAKTLSTILLEECLRLYDNKPGDDTTVCTVKIRKREPMNLMIGPPSDPDDDNKMMSLFFSKQGKHIVCGGTTSNLAARYLNKPMTTDLNYVDPKIPPIAHIKGVDLVTEGVITLSQVVEYAKNYLADNECYAQWSYKKDAASQIARLLFEEATDINFFVGKAINPAHQNPNLPIHFNIKMQLVEELSSCLKAMGKRIKVNYF